jgi:hypothetical protein
VPDETDVRYASKLPPGVEWNKKKRVVVGSANV